MAASGTRYSLEFIPTAEETGLILPIGEWVISVASHQLSRWHEKFPSDPPLMGYDGIALSATR